MNIDPQNPQADSSMRGMNSMGAAGMGNPVLASSPMPGSSNVVTIDLVQVMHIIWSNILQIFLAALTGALAVYFVSAHIIHPRYSSTTKIYVMANEEVAKGNVDTSTLQAGMLLTHDYEQIIKSRKVTESVIANLGLDITSSQLKNMMTVEIPEGTRVIGISVSAGDPYAAADICDEIREVSMRRIQKVMDMKSIEVVEDANIPRLPYSPNSTKNALLGAIICALAAIIIVVSDSLMNNTIQTSEDIERYLGMSTLGSIPYDEMEDDERVKRRKNPLAGRIGARWRTEKKTKRSRA